MLTLFRTNQLPASILLIFYVLVLRLSVFFVPAILPMEASGILSQVLYEWIDPMSTTAIVAAMVLIWLQALYINYLFMEHRIADEVTLFPGLFYILLASCFPSFLYLSPELLANTFFIIAIGELLAIYKKNTCADRIFNAGFWIGVGGLFHASVFFLFFLGILGLRIMRAFKLREVLMMLVGFICPIFLAGVYFFWNNEFQPFWNFQFDTNLSFLDFSFTKQWSTYLEITTFILLSVFVFFSYTSFLYKRKIEDQKKINIIFWSIFFVLIASLFQGDIQINQFIILTVPLGILLGFRFIKFSHRWAEALHFIMLLCALTWQFRPLLIY